MKREEAIEILNENPLEFDIEDSMFGDGSVVVCYPCVFDTKAEAKKWIKAIKTLATSEKKNNASKS